LKFIGIYSCVILGESVFRKRLEFHITPEVTGSLNSKLGTQQSICVITVHRVSDGAQAERFSEAGTFTVITTKIWETLTNNFAVKKRFVLLNRWTCYIGYLTIHCHRHIVH
jgi:hypothetical protein